VRINRPLTRTGLCIALSYRRNRRRLQARSNGSRTGYRISTRRRRII